MLLASGLAAGMYATVKFVVFDIHPFEFFSALDNGSGRAHSHFCNNRFRCFKDRTAWYTCRARSFHDCWWYDMVLGA